MENFFIHFFNYFLLFILICLLIDNYFRAYGYKGPKTDHFDGKKFHNISSSENIYTILKEVSEVEDGFLFWFGKFLVSWKKRKLIKGEAKLEERVLGKRIVVTMINHSTVLIQTEGVNILTDPVWLKRASPFPFFGPKRYMPAGISLKNLPPIDIILQTHNHYDHLDIKALKRIMKKYTPALYTTLGNKNYLKNRGIYGAIEMDWGEEKKFSDLISIECVPAQHFAARALSDRDNTLWGGFVVKTLGGNIYFAGDTGYGPFVSHLKKIYPDGFRLALLPIGAYEPRRFMSMVHTSPDDAVRMYKELNVKEAVGIHFGTFKLALDGQDEPPKRIKELTSLEENRNIKFHTLWNGESVNIS